MKSISKIKSLFVFSALTVLLFSCENYVEEDIIIPINQEDESQDEGQDKTCNPDVSFSSEIKPIIDTNCIRCHGGSTSPDLRTYQNVSNNAARVRTQVVNRTMPQGGSLSNEQIELISCWVDNGALNN